METSQYLKTTTITVISIPKPFYSKSDFLHRTSDSIARLKEVRNGNISVLENVTITVITVPKPFYSKSDSFARLKEARNGKHGFTIKSQSVGTFLQWHVETSKMRVSFISRSQKTSKRS